MNKRLIEQNKSDWIVFFLFGKNVYETLTCLGTCTIRLLWEDKFWLNLSIQKDTAFFSARGEMQEVR